MTRASFKAVAAVPIENLRLDLSNARIRRGQDQVDCIARILRKEAQFMALATDIAEKGLSTAPILAQPQGKNFIVWDGNRRVAALKLLNEPAACPVTLVRKRLEVLAERHAKSILRTVDVLASSNINALVEEVLKQHAGALGGVGQLDWSTFLRSVFMASHNVPEANRRAALLFLWAEEHGVEVADETKVTSLTRFLTQENAKLLGFDVSTKTGVVQPLVPVDKAIVVTQRLASDFSPLGPIGVDQVFTADAASRYVAGVLDSVGLTERKPGGAGSSGGRPGGSSSGGSQSGQGGSADDGEDDDRPVDAKPGRKPRRPTKPSWDRTRLLSRSGRPTFDITDEDSKAHNIVVELGKINPYDVPLAAAALMRMLIEFSEANYRRRYRNVPRGDAKRGDLKRTADHMLANARIDDGDHANFMRYVKEPGALLHYETLNAYLHAPKAQPVGQTLCVFYDDVEPFVRACWN